jgi:serpin B
MGMVTRSNVVRMLFVGAVLASLVAACGEDTDAGSTADGDPGTSGSTSSVPSDGADDGDEPVPAGAFEPTSTERAPVDPEAPVAEVAAALNEVGWALWASADLAPDANAVISPSSIGHALLMARAAADETTAAAIDAALGLPEGTGAHEGWNAIDQAIGAAAEGEEELTVTLADRIWPRLDVEPSQEWIDVLATHHGATVQPLDFAGDEPGSREVINGWVSDRTEGLIPELLPAGFINPQTVLVLTDAVYLKAAWQTPFGKYGPVEGEFTLLDGSVVPVELMQELELTSPRGSGDGWVAAEIPYVGGAFSMLVIVPDKGRFDEVRGRLGAELLDEINASLTTGPFELLLPQWKDKTEQLDLLPWLSEIGAAPGTYPAITPDAFLDAAVHGADITVDEWGTVAAAATAFGFEESGPPEPELTVAADQPFLYLIRHVDSGLVLFLGQVADPTAS